MMSVFLPDLVIVEPPTFQLNRTQTRNKPKPVGTWLARVRKRVDRAAPSPQLNGTVPYIL